MSRESDVLPELQKESGYGGTGTIAERDIPVIDLSDFDSRRDAIGAQLWDAATASGFFQLVNHGIAQQQIDDAYGRMRALFTLPREQKQSLAMAPGSNAGWEYMAQVRPSTGSEDRKESYQLTAPRMHGLWPKVPGFKETMLAFERANWALGMRVLSCFAERLGFERDFFTEAHDPLSEHYQSTLRLLHYLPMSEAVDPETTWRAGAHTDFDCLTLLHQFPGQDGLQLCPGAESDALVWTDVPARAGVITCNIGDMLMRWSDDRLKSTLHRVRMPSGEAQRVSRYSMAFFCQANRDVTIAPPKGSYPPISAHEYLQRRVAANSL